MTPQDAREPQLEVVDLCDLCGGERTRSLFPTRDRLHQLPGAFGLVRCEGCGLVRLSPRPVADELPRYYPGEDYLPHRAGGFTQGSPDRRFGAVRDGLRDEVLRRLGYEKPEHPALRFPATVLHRPLLRRATFGWEGFPPHVPDGHALDVGCGNGFFLALLRHHGWKVQGVDLSPDAAANVRRSFDIDVHVGEVTDDVFEPETLDFIHMSHVIEHVPSPVATMQRVFELLKPGGMLYVETPNIDSLGARIWGEHWFALDSPRHLWLFGPDTLRRLLDQSSLSVRRLRTLVWKDVEWEQTYRWEDETGKVREPRPSVDAAARPKLLLTRAATAAWHAVAPRSGDILSCWAYRPNAL